jgi:nucleoside 2-deoxyribosyltransferase
MRIVYVAGPISSDPLIGTRNAILAAAQLRSVGLGFIVPHLSCLFQMVSPQPYESWMGLDLALIERCDALLRLPGDSFGADREVQHARQQGIPVYLDVGQCINEMAPRAFEMTAAGGR